MKYEFGSCTVDTTTYEFWRGGELVSAEPQVFDLLVLFLQNRDRLVSKDEILDRIWNGRIVSEAALSSRISSLRQLIGDDGASQSFIRTVRGRGFRMVGDVRELPAIAAPEMSATPSSVNHTSNVSIASINDLGSSASADAEAEQTSARPGVAVLPFKFLAGEAEHEHFSVALVDDITSALSRMRTFFMVARGAASAYGKREADVREIARILDIRYVVQGSVRVAGSAARVCVQLNDAMRREEIWAGNFDGTLSNLIETADRMTELIVGVLQPTLLIAEIRRAQRRRSEDLSAYEYVMRAMPLCWALSKQACDDAIGLLKQAIELDSAHPLASALLSWCHGQQVVYNWTQERDFHRQQAIQLAQRAAALDDTDPLVLIKLATAESMAGNLPIAAAHIKNALDLDPYFAWAWTRCGYLNCYVANWQAALADFERALRLSPFDPMRHNTYTGMAFAHFIAERYHEAIAHVERALFERPDATWANRMLAACAAMVGDHAKAARSVATIEGGAPWIRAEDIVTAIPHQNDELRERLRGALIKAGFRP